jgi:hypothetical protein
LDHGGKARPAVCRLSRIANSQPRCVRNIQRGSAWSGDEQASP